MSGPVLLVLGSGLILLGLFVLIEAVISLRRWRVATAGVASPSLVPEAYAEPYDEAYDDEAPPIAPAQEDLEMVIIGERETNPDGSSRQDIIRDLEIGDPVELIPEASDPDGRNEIRVSAGGSTIGYVPPSKVPRLLDLISEGAETHAEVSHIATAEDMRGVWVNVSVWR